MTVFACLSRPFRRAIPCGNAHGTLRTALRGIRHKTSGGAGCDLGLGKTFFNRQREIDYFTNAFGGDPELHIVLGPPSTGKTSLIREVVNRGNFRPLMFNCRGGEFSTPRHVYNSLSQQFHHLLQEVRKTCREGLNFKTEYTDAAINLTSAADLTHSVTADEVSTLLDTISDSLPLSTFWHGKDMPPPILVIDEADMLSQLADGSAEGAKLLRIFTKWLVQNTEQNQRFHAVLTSSDSFFLKWLERELQIHALHLRPHDVGDLNMKKAEKFFEQYILPKYPEVQKELEGEFSKVRQITGTRMFVINRYVNEIAHNGGKRFKNEEFSMVQREYNRLQFALVPDTLPQLRRKPEWNMNDLRLSMKEMVKAKDKGYILKKDLQNLIGENQVNSLVEYNILHQRLPDGCADDLIDRPIRKTVLTPTNQPALCAMEIIENELD